MHANSEACHCQSLALHCRKRIRTLVKGLHACPVWKRELVLGCLQYQVSLYHFLPRLILCRYLPYFCKFANVDSLQALQQCCFITVFRLFLQCSQNTQECSTSNADNDVELPQHDVDAVRPQKVLKDEPNTGACAAQKLKKPRL
jgi:hypothetical protein